ncbi:A disintegrin and metalloproteinase with thrombospondin motifs adt-2-like isoform X2 [Paramacrobiotus metropolitanus]|uniref:A disintegrin and metalloproteinase with thrombospondin motifs adt-2-like isoform X2 n=1 Tax=Paramacrobiotus metropolitanus TaxID=2943436 RepID=UPI002445A904|nr:A disintegrin and metalloproteinase with thrombospondin motifs adt-2-like isoform X2 [Paramacrobiotus metropolitanus]
MDFLLFGCFLAGYTFSTAKSTNFENQPLHQQLTRAEHLSVFGHPDLLDQLPDVPSYEVITPYHPFARVERSIRWPTRCPKTLHRTLKMFNKTVSTDVTAKSDICAYRMNDHNTSAAVHVVAQDYTLNGYISHNDELYRISPVPPRLRKRALHSNYKTQHIVFGIHNLNLEALKTRMGKSLDDASEWSNAQKCAVDGKAECPNGRCLYETQTQRLGRSGSTNDGKRATLELSVFLDAEAYKRFSGYLGSTAIMHDFLLLFLHQVDLLLHLPTFGPPVDVKLVKLTMLTSQPTDIPTSGDIETTLAAFSAYQKNLNSAPESDPSHWDHALYLTSIKLSRGGTDYTVMGMSRVGAVCNPDYSATVAELGAKDKLQNAVQSSGFMAAYMVAHEIGHSIGLMHDGDGNSCPTGKYIMSGSRGWSGQTLWSECSKTALQEKLASRSCLYDTNSSPMSSENNIAKFPSPPGQIYTANAQCALQMQNPQYVRDPIQKISEICGSLQCLNSVKGMTSTIGPALDGTYCGSKNWCSGGDCVPWTGDLPVSDPGWSSWAKGACESGCIEHGTGYQITQRLCNNPEPQNTETGCAGENHQVSLCSDNAICGARQSASAYASQKCQAYYTAGVTGIMPEGKQFPYDSDKPESACAIYCKTDAGDSYKHPKNAVAVMLGQEAYFPDGTWCNSDGSRLYFCIDHRCVPQSDT